MREKKELRKVAQERCQALHPPLIMGKSKDIFAHLEQLPEYKEAKRVMLYVSKKDEVETRTFLRAQLSENQDREFFVPFMADDLLRVAKVKAVKDLVPGKYNILEPKEKDAYEGALDLILVPGVAFDETGTRLGRGGGHYDRFLKEQEGKRIGLAFQEQLLYQLPREEHDIPMHMIITEQGIIRCENEHGND